MMRSKLQVFCFLGCFALAFGAAVAAGPTLPKAPTDPRDVTAMPWWNEGFRGDAIYGIIVKGTAANPPEIEPPIPGGEIRPIGSPSSSSNKAAGLSAHGRAATGIGTPGMVSTGSGVTSSTPLLRTVDTTSVLQDLESVRRQLGL